MGQREWGPRHKPGFDQLKKGHEAVRVTRDGYRNPVFNRSRG